MGRGRRYSSSDDERDRSKRHRDGSRAKRRRSPSAEGSAADAYARRRHRSRSPDWRRSDRSRDRVRSRNRRGISRSRSPRGSENSRNNVASASPGRDYRPKRRRPRSRSRSKARSRSRSRRRNRSRSKSRSRSRDYKRRERRREQRRRSRSRSRSRSPHRRADRYRDASRSPRKSRKRSPSFSPSPPPARSRKPLPSQDVSFRGTREGAVATSDDKPPPEKQKPNYGNTGILARETNIVAGTNIVLKYNEPPDARKPPSSHEWRLYVFKGQDLLNTIPIHTRSCWLMGREIAIADMYVEHPSISKQHAVIQFKHSVKVNEFGDRESRVKPYVLDLESSNGTTLNGEKIQPTRFVELRDKDVIKLGLSEREYVVMLPPKD